MLTNEYKKNQHTQLVYLNWMRGKAQRRKTTTMWNRWLWGYEENRCRYHDYLLISWVSQFVFLFFFLILLSFLAWATHFDILLTTICWWHGGCFCGEQWEKRKKRESRRNGSRRWKRSETSASLWWSNRKTEKKF